MIRGSATPRISFGFIVSNLYELIPRINWFSIILLGCTLFSWYLLGLLAFRSHNILAVSVFFVISFLHLFWFIPNPTYTAAAVILSFSTLIFLSKQVLEGKINFSFITLSFSYVFSFLTRPESFLLGSAVAFPFILFVVIKNNHVIKKDVKYILASILIVISVIGIDVAVEKIYYKNNSSWTEYQKWEAARYRIQANSPEKVVLENPANYGWTKAEAELFKTYNYIDSKTYTVGKLEKLIADSEQATNINLQFLKKAHQQIFNQEVNWGWQQTIQLISMIFVLYLILSFPRPFNYLVLTGTSFVIIYFTMIYVAGFLRQPERVQVSVIFLSILVCWVSFVFTKKSDAMNEINEFSVLSWIILVLIISSAFSQSLHLKTKVAGAPNVFWLTQKDYLSTFPKNSIFVGNASQFRNNWISPYKVEQFEVENRIFTFGWHNFSPHWVKRAQNLGLDPNNMFNSVIEDPRVYWVSDPESMEYIVSYMKERNYNFIGPEIVGKMDYVGNEYIVWNFNPRD